MPIKAGDALTIRVGTWNIDRPARNPRSKGAAIRFEIERVDADIWVLTENRESFQPRHDYHGVHSAPHPERRPDEDERWASVWSRWPIRKVWEDEWSVTANVSTPNGDLLVHGVVLPYMNEPAYGGVRVPGWTRFREELDRQRSHWIELRDELGFTPAVLAGDFNQSLAASRWYGSRSNRQVVLDAFDTAGFRCETLDVVLADDELPNRPLVDHICISKGLCRFGAVICWGPRGSGGMRLSDHPGVAVDLLGTVN